MSCIKYNNISLSIILFILPPNFILRFSDPPPEQLLAINTFFGRPPRAKFETKTNIYFYFLTITDGRYFETNQFLENALPTLFIFDNSVGDFAGFFENFLTFCLRDNIF